MRRIIPFLFITCLLPGLVSCCKEEEYQVSYFVNGHLQYRSATTEALETSDQITSLILPQGDGPTHLPFETEKTGSGFSFGPLPAGSYRLEFLLPDSQDGTVLYYQYDTLITLSDKESPEPNVLEDLDLGTLVLTSDISLVPPPPDPVTALEVKITNEDGYPFNQVQVCLFANSDLLDQDTTCQYALCQAPTGADGTVLFSNLDTATYFIRASIEVNDSIWSNRYTDAVDQTPEPITFGDTTEIAIIIKAQ